SCRRKWPRRCGKRLASKRSSGSTAPITGRLCISPRPWITSSCISGRSEDRFTSPERPRRAQQQGVCTMRRVVLAACVLVGGGAWISAAPTPTPPMPLPQKLAQRVKFDGIGDPKITLSEALDKLNMLYDINFDINEKAFKFENVADVAKTPIIAENPIPAMKN